MTATSLAYEVDKYSLAQSFYVDEENGIYITKILLYFQNIGKSPKLPVQLELRPMVNGFPSSANMIPGSEVVVKSSDIKVSTDASAHTNFEFEEPIFLNGLTDYCFVVASNTADYKLFAAQGDTFVIGSTEERISKQQTNGSLFFSQNAATFTAAQDTDLSFKIKRARFKHTSGIVTLKNASVPQVLLDPNPISFDSGSTVLTINHPNHGLQPNDIVNISGSGTVGGIAAAKINGAHRVVAHATSGFKGDSSVDFSGFKIDVFDSAIGFGTAGGNAVLCDKNIPYSIAHPNVEVLLPNATVVSAGIKPTITKNLTETNYGSSTRTLRYSKDTNFSALSLNTDNESETPFVILNNSVADSANLSADGTVQVQVTMATDDSNVAPMIDLQRTSFTAISFQIDDQVKVVGSSSTQTVPINFVDETRAAGSSSASKHISAPIQLEEEAVGLKIMLSANRPENTSFDLYFRTAKTDELLSDQPFVLQAEATNNPIDNDRGTFRDYEYLAGGIGGDLVPFTQFQIKIVIKSTNIAVAPTFQSLRVIAMTT